MTNTPFSAADFLKSLEMPNLNLPTFVMPKMPLPLQHLDLENLIPPNPVYEQARLNSSGRACKHILSQVASFEQELDVTQEVGAHLASFGSSMLIRLRTIKAIDPNMIVFGGTVDGTEDPATLIQHLHQLSVLLVKVKAAGPIPNRIGFFLHDDEQKDGGKAK